MDTSSAHPFRIFGISVLVSIAALVAAGFYGGLTTVLLVGLLIVFELSLSMDNAIINARIVAKLSDKWQKIFLSIGILIAVFGMRLLFPLIIVGFATGLNPIEAFNLAREQGDPETPGTYGYIINEAFPTIAAFGGMFLFMLFLDFIFDHTRDIHWLRWVEIPLSKVGQIQIAPVIVGLAGILLIAQLSGNEGGVIVAGIIGMVTYLLVKSLGDFFENKIEEDAEKDEEKERNGVKAAAIRLTGKAAFASFLYLEVLDASFSLDGVVGALALSTDPIVIFLGLGAGAMFVRSLTIFLVRKGTLNDYAYLDHGAHWAIGALAVILLASVSVHIPEIITGLIGVSLIIAAFVTSVISNKKKDQAEISQISV